MLGAMSSDGKDGRPVRRPRVIERPQVPPGPRADLKALVYELYLQAGAPSLDQMAAIVAADDELAGAPGRDTIGRVIGDPGLPASQADVVAVVTMLARAARWDPGDAAGRARDLWVAARMASARYPAGGVRVDQADPRRLGVHAAISVAGIPDEVPPEYVRRDADGGGSGIRAKIAAAAQRGGFVLLVGGSSVGKTRCAFEAVTALLPDWWLVHPAGPREVTALAAAPVPRTVVWLDELQRYLDGEHGVGGGAIRALLNAPDAMVIIGTIWPDRYTAYTTPPSIGGADPYARERQILDLADVVRIGPVFSGAEQSRARAAAVRDPRLQEALGSAGYGLTQTLAAAPQLVAFWEDAQTDHPYAWAVLAAALDAAHLGARAPLTADLLRAATPGYCTSQQRAEAPDDWFEQALAYATGKLHGAVSALRPAGASMGQVAGYTPADYLIQYVSRKRRSARVPASTWNALISHIPDPADSGRLAHSASRRLLYHYAISLYRHAADDDETAAQELAKLLARRGDWDELRTRADSGDGHAAEELAKLLDRQGDLDELRTRADSGDGHAARRLADRGDPERAMSVLRALADSGDAYAAEELADLLARRGDLDELRARADSGDAYAAEELADLLADQGDLDEAIQMFRALADANPYTTRRLAELLAQRGDLDELRARADADDWAASGELARLLARRGDLDELRARADSGDEDAASELADLLAKRGDLEGALQVLRTLANVGGYVARPLQVLLTKQGCSEEAGRLIRFGLNPDGSIARA